MIQFGGILVVTSYYSYFCNISLRLAPGPNPWSDFNNSLYILFSGYDANKECVVFGNLISL